MRRPRRFLQISRCIRAITVSSLRPLIAELLEGVLGFWERSGSPSRLSSYRDRLNSKAPLAPSEQAAGPRCPFKRGQVRSRTLPGLSARSFAKLSEPAGVSPPMGLCADNSMGLGKIGAVATPFYRPVCAGHFRISGCIAIGFAETGSPTAAGSAPAR